MSSSLTHDQMARVTLAALSEPGDGITGALLHIYGASETVRMIATEEPLPDTVDRAEAMLWRERMRSRQRDADLDRVVADTERRRLAVITPEDSRWPAGLSQLGIHAPVALWVAGNDRALAPQLARRYW